MMRGNPMVLFSTGFRIWMLFCYCGGSLLGALEPDALTKLWWHIKTILPGKSPGTHAKRNGAED